VINLKINTKINPRSDSTTDLKTDPETDSETGLNIGHQDSFEAKLRPKKPGPFTGEGCDVPELTDHTDCADNTDRADNANHTEHADHTGAELQAQEQIEQIDPFELVSDKPSGQPGKEGGEKVNYLAPSQVGKGRVNSRKWLQNADSRQNGPGQRDIIPSVSPSAPHGSELVIESRNWYLGQNERLFKVVLFLCPILLLSLALNAWQFFSQKDPKYFAVTRDLRVLEMPPLEEPVIESQALVNWASEVIARALSLNFLTWRKTITDLRSDFDPQAFDSFLAALDSGGHIKKIEQERLSLSCVISGAPVITSSSVKNGVMTWRLEMPLSLSYESSTGVVASQKLLAEVVINRAPTTKYPKGVVIKQVVLSKLG
jgi:intracellular multiplication protein IcmL